MDNSSLNNNRRPLKTRSARWAQRLAAYLVRIKATPDHISALSIVFAVGGAALLAVPGLAASPAALIAAAACVQLRLVCNLLDGMVAIEGGRKSPIGGLWNELPDRVADSLFIVALGYAAGQPALGWFGALAAAVTAYIRQLGGTLGLAQDFRGPMAKQHRMAVLTAVCVIGAFERWFFATDWVLLAGAWIIALGSLLTCVTRTRAIAAQLRARAATAPAA